MSSGTPSTTTTTSPSRDEILPSMESWSISAGPFALERWRLASPRAILLLTRPNAAYGLVSL